MDPQTHRAGAFDDFLPHLRDPGFTSHVNAGVGVRCPAWVPQSFRAEGRCSLDGGGGRGRGSVAVPREEQTTSRVTLRIRGPRGNAGDEEIMGHRESAPGSAVCPGVRIGKDSTLKTRANDGAPEQHGCYSLWDLTSPPGNVQPLLPDPCRDTQAWLCPASC